MFFKNARFHCEKLSGKCNVAWQGKATAAPVGWRLLEEMAVIGLQAGPFP